MKKKPKSYSLSPDLIDAISRQALHLSQKSGKRISDSELVEKILQKGIKLAKNNKS